MSLVSVNPVPDPPADGDWFGMRLTMINNSMLIEKFLQDCRFKMAKPYLIGDVLDFGGNQGELREFVKGKYLVVNYDHSVMENTHFDTIVSLAVSEHINVPEVFEVFKKFKNVLNNGGRIFLTTPTKMAKPILEFMAYIGLLDRKNIHEHKHYWNQKEIFDLAEKSGFLVKEYKKFEIGFNQLAVFEHK